MSFVNYFYSRILEEPRFYVTVEGQNELKGISTFWSVMQDSEWSKVTALNCDCDLIAATIVMDFPKFTNNTIVKAFGTILYTLDGKQLQAPVNCFKLTAVQAIGKSLTIRHAQSLIPSVLAIRATTIEKTFTISLTKEPNCGMKIFNFLQQHGFHEVFTDIFISNNSDSFRHCLLETVYVTTEIILRICGQ